MGAIQQAVNQGIMTASVLGQLSGVPELKKAGKLEKTVAQSAHRKTEKGEYALSHEEYAKAKPAVEAYVQTQKNLFEKTGKKKYLDEYNETVETMKQFETKPFDKARMMKANARAREQRQTKQYQNEYVKTSIGMLPREIVEKSIDITGRNK